jgi:hypothetical protein
MVIIRVPLSLNGQGLIVRINFDQKFIDNPFWY